MSVLNVSLTDAVTTKVAEQISTAGIGSNLNPQFPANSYSFQNGLSTGGTVAGLCDLWWAKAGVAVASSGTVTYTLSALTDDIGRSIAFVRIRLILLQITTSTGNDDLVIGNAGTHPWAAPFGSATYTIKIRNLWHIVDNSPAALVVTASSSDQLLITNAGSASITYSILLAGNSD